MEWIEKRVLFLQDCGVGSGVGIGSGLGVLGLNLRIEIFERGNRKGEKIIKIKFEFM